MNDNEDEISLNSIEKSGEVYNTEPSNEIVAANTNVNSGGDLERSVENVSVKIGQHASLPCFVPNIGSFKVSISIKNRLQIQIQTNTIN